MPTSRSLSGPGTSAPSESLTTHLKLGVGISNDRAHDPVRTKCSISPNPPDLTLAQPLDQSLLVERENRVNPGGSQRWDQAREYCNHNEE